MRKEGRTAIPRHMTDRVPKNVVARPCRAVQYGYAVPLFWHGSTAVLLTLWPCALLFLSDLLPLMLEASLGLYSSSIDSQSRPFYRNLRISPKSKAKHIVSTI